jgi:hypothetical protein
MNDYLNDFKFRLELLEYDLPILYRKIKEGG